MYTVYFLTEGNTTQEKYLVYSDTLKDKDDFLSQNYGAVVIYSRVTDSYEFFYKVRE